MPEGSRQQLIRENFEYQTTVPFLIIKNLNYDTFRMNSNIIHPEYFIENPIAVTSAISSSKISININEDLENDICTYVEEK
ncbi:8588_t:CDS:2 [Cetraspora pellucida]|uniref:8588_t:CDS:1 n=1 Tax=Cetraspora pellucida TaxID=1433469 RepID=A0ACA9KCK9_9GLOM|nr:8588_t:CDS:2 [Cetraspora pellucida]